MKRNLFSIVIVLMVLLLGLACSPQATSASEASATPNPAVQGGEVELGDTVEQAFFTVAGQILKVNGKDVQVFEYESPEKMEADAAQVASDGGSIGTSMVTWVEPPHFLKSGRVLVLYVGEDKAVIDLLKGALGEQFAGR